MQTAPECLVWLGVCHTRESLINTRERVLGWGDKIYRSWKVLLLCKALPRESNQPRNSSPVLGWDLGPVTYSRAGSQAGAHYPGKAPTPTAPSWTGHPFSFPGYLLCPESSSSCDQEIGKPQKMKGKLSKSLSPFFNPAGSGLRLGYWIALWAQLTHLSHHKSPGRILRWHWPNKLWDHKALLPFVEM